MMTLGIIWYALIGVLIAGYAVLDGFDLGVGTLYPFVAKNEEEKAVLRTSIGPVWDGNEVWLLTGGGALFAAFPPVYATVFSGFYLAMMLVLFCLIFRAVSLENRTSGSVAPLWDWAFFLGSALPALLFGVAMGNIVRGVPLDTDGRVRRHLLHPAQPVRAADRRPGVEHVRHPRRGLGGAQVRRRPARPRGGRPLGRPLGVRRAGTGGDGPDRGAGGRPTGAGHPQPAGLGDARPAGRRHRLHPSEHRPGRRRRRTPGFGAGILGLVGLVAVGNYPNLVPALDHPERSLTVSNSASSDLTLTVMLIIAVVGVPIVLAYTALVYRSFWGRISAGDASGH